MGYSDVTYMAVKSALTSASGTGPVGDDGQPMPNMSPMDMFAVLGWATPMMAKAIDNFNAQYNAGSDGNAAILVGADGQPQYPGSTSDAGMWEVQPASGSYLASGPYLASPVADPNRPWLRMPDPATPSGVYTVWLTPQSVLDAVGVGSPAEPILSFVEQTIADWQKMCDAVGAAIIASDGVNLTAASGADEISLFLSAFGAWCSDMDSLSEQPPVSTDISGALRSAAASTVDWVGNAAAKAGEVAGDLGARVAEGVGKTAAGLANGFFSQAGLISVVVAGVVVYLFVR